ncbi:MAG TPA: adenylate/guanylate cyclase domain-containing protein [Steroidobacteraceae bacterium]|nr:adenylate/guanylate cyclase domain-containing protein [Steroidobacteraceae bacterium]
MSQERLQRRLAAILFADVVGYSRLTGQDEVGTWRRLQSVLREAVGPHLKAHAGRIIRIKGDGILVEFASAVEAVASAVALQQAMAQRNATLPDAHRIELRIGINLGDIITNHDDVHGEGVNVTARLEPLAEPGGICISATVHEHVRTKLAYPFEDRGMQTLKNIAEPVRVYALGPERIASLPTDTPSSVMPRKRIGWYAAAIAAGSVCVAALWMVWAQFAPPSIQVTGTQTALPGTLAASVAEPIIQANPPRLSIVVLPFANTAHDSEQEYFAEGMTEDLTTDLSRIPGSFVIAPSTAFSYRGKPIDVRQIGRELSVRYVLQGNVRRITDSLRINAQLVEAANASQLWAERFDGQIAQLTKVQDEVTQRIAGALNVALIDAESQRALRERLNNPDAIDLTMRGMALLNKPASRENMQRARGLFEETLRLSPDHLPALNGLAHVMLIEWGSTWYTGSSDEHLEALDRIVNQALAIKPDDPLATYFQGYVLKRLRKNLNQALVAFERAIAIDPNLAVAHNYVGQIKVFLGRASEAAEHTLKAIQLSPRDPQLAEWYYQLAITYVHQRRYDEAVEWARRGVQVNPNLRYPYRVLAAALALSGQVDEARMAAAEMLRRYPKETISTFLTREPWTNPIYRAGQDREIAGMRLAGIPD